jgi:hypothetical protein
MNKHQHDAPHYEAALYRGGEGRGQTRWAVFCMPSRCFIFPGETGRAAAQRTADGLNATEA